MISFDNKVLFVGYGAVARCALPIFVDHIKVPCEKITVLDFEDRSEVLRPWTERGVRFVRLRITPQNMGMVLGKYLASGDLLVDLAWNIDCCNILQWCHDRGVLYVNTSMELWDPYEGNAQKHPTERTLYRRHLDVRETISQWTRPSPTAVLEHGANPGLISHFVKQGLLDIGQRLLEEKKLAGPEAEEIGQLISDRVFNRLAMKLGVKVIHCSERDTQITNRPKEVDEFVTPGASRGSAKRGRRPPSLAGGPMRRSCRPWPTSMPGDRKTRSVWRGWG